MSLGFRKFISEVFMNGKFPKILPSENFLLYGIFENANLKGGFIRALQTLSGYSSTKYMTKFLYRLIG